MKMGKVRFGVVGVGRIGKVHLENLVTRIPGAEVLGLADVDFDEAQKLAHEYGIPSAVRDCEELLNRPEIDAIAVCSSTDTHARIVRDAASAGKHVFCEKPIDLSLEEIRKTLARVRQGGVKLMVGFNRRFDANFLKVREMVAAGKVGKPHLLKITSRDPAPPSPEYIQSSGGIFLDMTIHDFDMARYLMGSEVIEVFARGAVLIDPVFEKAGDWDTAVILLTFENGAMGVIDNSRKAVYGYDQRVEVFGSEGMVAVGNDTPDRHVHLDAEGSHSALPLYFFLERYMESYAREMSAFVKAIDNDSAVPVTGEDGLAAVRVGLAALRSARENRPVKLSEI